MMKIKRFYFATMLFILLLAECAVNNKEVKKESPEEIYNKAVKKLERKKFVGLIPYRNTETAIELFQKIIDDFPNTKYALLAEIGLADANFYKDEYDEAQSRYSEFYTLHPGNELTPYAIYMSGRCFEELATSYDQDLTPVKNAIYEYRKLIQNYPASEYVNDAETHLKALDEKLAKREFYTGKFYFRRKKYHSAIERFTDLLKNYPDSSLRELTLYYIYNSYYRIKDFENARKYYNQLLEEFPHTKYRNKKVEVKTSSADTSPQH